MGTAGYMSPEQVRGENLDARTDLFSFGLVLYEIATGKRAFTGDTWPAFREAILEQMPDAPRRINPKIPAKLEAVIKKALEKNRDVRYQTASEMRADLENLQRQLAPKHLSRPWVVRSRLKSNYDNSPPTPQRTRLSAVRSHRTANTWLIPMRRECTSSSLRRGRRGLFPAQKD